MRDVLCLVKEKVASDSVATYSPQRLSNLPSAPNLEHTEAQWFVTRISSSFYIFQVPIDSWNDAITKVPDVTSRDKAGFPELSVSGDLKAKDNPKVRDCCAGQHAAVAFSSVLVLGSIKHFPIQAEHGRHLDQVGDGGHCVF